MHDTSIQDKFKLRNILQLPIIIHIVTKLKVENKLCSSMNTRQILGHILGKTHPVCPFP